MNEIEYEQHIVHRMLLIYCKKHHQTNDELCESCAKLNEYAFTRLEKCKFGNAKPACKDCPVHCYKPDMRADIRNVMRFAGPRMAFYYPLDAWKHLLRKFHKKPERKNL
ncbi:MAG: hypothetical protein AUK44_04790 [Porphyromonadaceae bacterium CG2_30_38_12]|nr:MAG: hypothetical protein AUK44_04790 [Porphyromonadaceae bacterium CG2_30_38_12]